MNKIEIVNKEKVNNDKIDVLVEGTSLKIQIKDKIDSPLVLIDSVYKDIIVTVNDDINVTILEIKNKVIQDKCNYKYVLGSNSHLNINKFNCSEEYQETIKMDLNGISSEIVFNLSVISLGKCHYDITINHNNKNTVSNIVNHGVTYEDATIDFIVNGAVFKGMSNSVLNQDNRIITMGNGKSVIKPNLYIDEHQVEARHGASIGKFNEDEVFYLETRGIPRILGYQLLMEGFLLGSFEIDDEMKESLINIIKEKGR